MRTNQRSAEAGTDQSEGSRGRVSQRGAGQYITQLDTEGEAGLPSRYIVVCLAKDNCSSPKRQNILKEDPNPSYQLSRGLECNGTAPLNILNISEPSGSRSQAGPLSQHLLSPDPQSLTDLSSNLV